MLTHTYLSMTLWHDQKINSRLSSCPTGLTPSGSVQPLWILIAYLSLPFCLHFIHSDLLQECKAFQTHFLFIIFAFVESSVWNPLAPKLCMARFLSFSYFWSNITFLRKPLATQSKLNFYYLHYSKSTCSFVILY